MVAGYIPDAGDIVWLDFDPQTGREQAGHRPALVLSPAAYNDRTSPVLCCPMTTRVKGYPFEVPVAGSKDGVALADQIKSLDWRKRNARPKGRASAEELSLVRAKAVALFGKPQRLRSVVRGLRLGREPTPP